MKLITNPAHTIMYVSTDNKLKGFGRNDHRNMGVVNIYK